MRRLLELQNENIEIGDWVYSAPWRGKVVGEGFLGKAPTWKVDTGGGRIMFFPKNATELWFKADE